MATPRARERHFACKRSGWPGWPIPAASTKMKKLELVSGFFILLDLRLEIEAASGTDVGASRTSEMNCFIPFTYEPGCACKRNRALQGRFPSPPPKCKRHPVLSDGVYILIDDGRESNPCPVGTRGREQYLRTVRGSRAASACKRNRALQGRCPPPPENSGNDGPVRRCNTPSADRITSRQTWLCPHP